MAMDAQPAGIPAAVWLATFKYAPANLISFLLRFSKTQPLQDQLPGLQISRWTIATIRQVSRITWSRPGAPVTAIAP
jgi:hypothetical protein